MTDSSTNKTNLQSEPQHHAQGETAEAPDEKADSTDAPSPPSSGAQTRQLWAQVGAAQSSDSDSEEEL